MNSHLSLICQNFCFKNFIDFKTDFSMIYFITYILNFYLNIKIFHILNKDILYCFYNFTNLNIFIRFAINLILLKRNLHILIRFLSYICIILFYSISSIKSSIKIFKNNFKLCISFLDINLMYLLYKYI